MAASEATRYFPFLDPVEERAILAAAPVKSFARNDVVVDQNVRTVLGIADRVYVMHAGRIVYEGSAAALADDADARNTLGLAA